MEWNNELQKAIIQEWTEGVQEATTDRARRGLRKRIATKYGLGIYLVQGVIELVATQGMTRTGNGTIQGGRTWKPVDPVEWLESLEEWISAIERRQNHIDDGIVKVLDSVESTAIYMSQLRKISQRRNIVEVGESPRFLKKR